jgi:hypothetical protein
MLVPDLELEEFREVADFFEGLIACDFVVIPQKLRDALPAASRKAKGQAIAALVWALIDQRTRFDSERKARIHTKAFAAIAGTEAVAKAKTWLVENGFLKVSDDYSSGRRSKEYQLLRSGKLVQHELKKKSAAVLLEQDTADEAVCKFTRRNLACLTADTDLLLRLFVAVVARKLDAYRNAANAEDFKNEDSLGAFLNDQTSLVIAVRNIIHGAGRVFRDSYGRLHSPFTNLKREFRAGFTAEGETLVGIDMSCCQPTLLALKTQERKFFDDCLADRLYGSIAALLDCSRDEAKDAYCHFAYSSNVTANSRDTGRRKIHEMFQRAYPVTSQYITEQKSGDYRQFSHRLMGYESELFIDGLLEEFCKKKMFCLSVHDGLFVKQSELEMARKMVIRKIRTEINGRMQREKGMELPYRIKIEDTQEKDTHILTVHAD